MLVILVLAILAIAAAVGSDRRPARARVGAQFEGPAAITRTGPIRIATFNVHSGRTAEDEPAWDRTVETLRGFDFIGLQEVRGGRFDAGQAAQLGADLSMAWCFAPSERRFWHDHFGNAALSRVPVTEWETFPLLNTRGKAYRNYLRTKLSCGGASVTVIVTHIDRNEDRLAQLDLVGDVFLASPPPVVLMGDLNSAADEPALRRLLNAPDVVDALAGAADPLARIDWILVRGLTITDAGVVDRGASDHPCYWVEIACYDEPG